MDMTGFKRMINEISSYGAKDAAGRAGRIKALDGIRALGIFFVVAGHLHVLGLTSTQETIGNFVFFAFTGFMAARPWLKDGEEQFVSYRYVASFYLKKFMRVMPVLLAAVVLYCVLDPSLSFVENITLVNLDGPAWFLPHIILFWLILPLFMIVIWAIKRLLPLENIDLAIAAISVIFANISRDTRMFWVIPMLGADMLGYFRLHPIMLGFAFGYLCKSSLVKKLSERKVCGCLLHALSAAAVGLIFLSNDLFSTDAVRNWLYSEMHLVCPVLIAAVFLTQKEALARALGWKPFCLVGQVSMEIMLFHMPFHRLLPLSGIPHFLLVFGGTILLGLLIEKVLMRPVNNVTALLAAKTMRPAKLEPVSVAIFLFLFCFAACSYHTRHIGKYSLGEWVGFYGEQATGYLNVVDGLGQCGIDSTPIEADGLELRFRLKEPPVYDLLATVRLVQLAEGSTVAVSLDGEDIGSVTVDGEGIMDVPVLRRFAQDRVIDMKLVPSTLGGGISSMMMKEDAPYQWGMELSFRKEEQTANAYFELGLGEAEELATWAKDRARLRIPLPEDTQSDLLLTLKWGWIDTHAQTMIVRCGGIELLHEVFYEKYETEIVIPQTLYDRSEVVLEFEFPDACPSSFAFTSMRLERA